MFSKWFMCSSPQSDVKRNSVELPDVMECQICFESFPDIDMYKVTCGSTVGHLICFDCETQWREKMPIREGDRKMTCPTCRQEESSRTVESLQREVKTFYSTHQEVMKLYREVSETNQATRQALGTLRSTRQTTSPAATVSTESSRPVSLPCASGRWCGGHSGYERTMTRLKCRRCDVVACCSRCRNCTGCRPEVP
jgi:hypothetical protein